MVSYIHNAYLLMLLKETMEALEKKECETSTAPQRQSRLKLRKRKPATATAAAANAPSDTMQEGDTSCAGSRLKLRKKKPDNTSDTIAPSQ